MKCRHCWAFAEECYQLCLQEHLSVFCVVLRLLIVYSSVSSTESPAPRRNVDVLQQVSKAPLTLHLNSHRVPYLFWVYPFLLFVCFVFWLSTSRRLSPSGNLPKIQSQNLPSPHQVSQSRSHLLLLLLPNKFALGQTCWSPAVSTISVAVQWQKLALGVIVGPLAWCIPAMTFMEIGWINF